MFNSGSKEIEEAKISCIAFYFDYCDGYDAMTHIVTHMLYIVTHTHYWLGNHKKGG